MIFIDTGAFLARYIPSDKFHAKALKVWKDLQKQRREFWTSNFVLDETITLLQRKTHPEFALERAKNIYSSTSLKILRPDLAEELKALELLSKYKDQSLSFTDCVSFALMKKYRIQTAFTFDKHFQIAGFEILS